MFTRPSPQKTGVLRSTDVIDIIYHQCFVLVKYYCTSVLKSLHCCAPLGKATMSPVKPISSLRASLPLVLMHALLITFLALNMVITSALG